MIKNIGICGQGFVGGAVREGLKKFFSISTYDKFKKTCSTVSSLEELSKISDIIFVCLPTPMNSDGSCHIDIVESVLTDFNYISTLGNNYCKLFIIKSTVPPGTTKMWNEKLSNIDIVFNPEFLTEANSVEDYKNQNRIILGGENKITGKVKPIFSKAFPKVHLIKTDSTYAEMVKYVTNCFLSTKVSFANEMYQICEGLEIDYDKVIEYSKHDERLGYSHWAVPGPDGDFGFGGHCFPKDLNSLIFKAKELGVEPIVLEATKKMNDKIRKNRDWEKQVGRAVIQDKPKKFDEE